MTDIPTEVGFDLLKAQPCPLCGAIGAEPCGRASPAKPHMAAVCPIRRVAVKRPAKRLDVTHNRPMSIEEMRDAYVTPPGED